MTTAAGAVLVSATDKAIGLLDRFAHCFVDGRDPTRTVHDVRTLVGQRVLGLCLGYEDLVDHDQLRHDPLLGALLWRLATPLSGKNTLNRLEHAPFGEHRYRKITPQRLATCGPSNQKAHASVIRNWSVRWRVDMG